MALEYLSRAEMTPRQLGHLLSMTSGGVTASEWGRGLEPFNGARGLSPG